MSKLWSGAWIAMVLGGLVLAGCGIGEDGVLAWPCSQEESFKAEDKCSNGEEQDEPEETAVVFEVAVSTRGSA